MIPCWKCGVVDNRPTYPDPCCGAPDCEHADDYVHEDCATEAVRQEIREFWKA